MALCIAAALVYYFVPTVRGNVNSWFHSISGEKDHDDDGHDDHDDHDGHDHAKHDDHDGHDHAKHDDHDDDDDGHDDHDGHDHAKHDDHDDDDHDGHDHAKHDDHDGHDHAGHNHSDHDGHNHEQIRKALLDAKQSKDKPTVIIANTIKGKGVSFMENDILWHYRFPHEGEEYDGALKELHQNMPMGIVDPYEEAGK